VTGRAKRRTPSVAARGLAMALVALTVAGLGGAVAESALARSDHERYPAPGRVVDTAQGPVHVHCSGSGSPTVLLEAGLGEPGLTWVDIQDELDRSLTVCSYDRAGYGWSPAADGSWDVRDAATQVSLALDAVSQYGPYLVVAHSVGALVARELHHSNPGSVAGLVLIDPTNEVTLSDVGTPAPAIAERTVLGVFARAGVVRLLGNRLVPALAGSRPPQELLDQAPAAYHSGAMAASVRELRGAPGAAAHLLTSEDTDWGDLPVTVVSAATTTQQDLDHHRDLAARSSAGQHLTADVGGHYIHYDDPDLVVSAICGVAAAAAAGGC
jgi:pimeloyl-ACP methyl ester carboxylesterase